MAVVQKILVAVLLTALLTDPLGMSVSAAEPNPCDEVCFLIEHTYVQSTLDLFLKQFPNSKYKSMISERQKTLERVAKGGFVTDAFPQPHIVHTEKLRSQPEGKLN